MRGHQPLDVDMPNLPTHISLALEVTSSMGYPVIDGHLGSFLLGCTSPDVTAMMKWKRDQTHFAPLTFERVGAGVDGLSRTHPNLADSSNVSDATKAFLSGYFTHLVADETWILEIYRPYFGGGSSFSDQVRANIWDRALQLDMDRRAREQLDGMGQVRGLLERSESNVDIGFISAETLGRWRDWVIEFTTWEFSWERLRFLTRRMYQDDPHATDVVEQFLQSVPTNLEHVYNVVSEETISDYRRKAVAGSIRLIKEYLSVPESD